MNKFNIGDLVRVTSTLEIDTHQINRIAEITDLDLGCYEKLIYCVVFNNDGNDYDWFRETELEAVFTV